MIEEWVQSLCEAMGVPSDEVDVTALLDLARDAAHSIDRTAVVGYASAQRGGGAEAVGAATAEAVTLARNWGEPPGT